MKTDKYLPTIGLEIHTQLKTKSKMFCGCENNSWKIGQEELKPNSAICPVCTGQPGSLPVANETAIKMVVKTGLALNCNIAVESKFDRKNYFYPDLPKGYQISQYDQPICQYGFLEINQHKIGITRIHLEEDTAKSTHPAGTDYSLIDFNRAGIPLMELVTEPDIHSAKDAADFCRQLQAIMRAIEVSDADMEKSQMRCEVNISLALKNSNQLGTKVEIKNLNSFKSVERSIQYEIIRQSKLLDQAEKIKHQTRGWNELEQKTFVQRNKEQAGDYRYFPEPDLPILKFNQEYIKKIKSQLPELPQEKIKRFQEQYNFSSTDCKLLVQNKALADFTENTMSELRAWLADMDQVDIEDEQTWQKYSQKLSRLTANWIINKLSGILSSHKKTIEQVNLTPENFAEFITLIYASKVNSTNAVKLLEQMIKTGGDPSDILEDQGLHLIENLSDLEPVVDKIIADFPDQVSAYKSGKQTLLKFFIGQTMKATSGKANPKMAEELIIQKLS